MFDNIKKINLNDALKRNKENLVIEPAVVDHCNLNCAYCDHFSPLAPPAFYDLDQFEKDFSTLSKLLLSDYILSRYTLTIQLVGGEPYLHPKLLDFADIVFKYIPVEYLHSFIIITNGTLFHKRMDLAEKHREMLRKYMKPGVVISKYPAVDEDFIRKSYAEYMGDPNHQIFLEYRDTFNKVNLDFRKQIRPEVCGDSCMCLRNGKLFKCPIPGNIQFLMNRLGSKYEVLKPEDYLDLTKPITPKELSDFHKDSTRNFCLYCRDRDLNVPWKRSERDPREWLAKR